MIFLERAQCVLEPNMLPFKNWEIPSYIRRDHVAEILHPLANVQNIP